MNAEAIQRVSTTIALLIEGALLSVEGVTSKVFIGPPSDPAFRASPRPSVGCCPCQSWADYTTNIS
jgi:hypothetical protein